MDLETFLVTYEAQIRILVHVLFGLLYGGLIGLERELKARPAGIRTHMMVAVSATLFTDISQLLATQVEAAGGASNINLDPSRVLVAIVTGVSFLGAGTIFRSQDGVTGLTTAASLLFVSALGVTVAVGEYLLAGVLTVIILIVLRVLSFIDALVYRKRKMRD